MIKITQARFFFICFLKLRKKKKGVTNILDSEIFIVSLYD